MGKEGTVYQFGGPIGAFFVTVGCPITTYAFYFICNEDGCPSSSFLQQPLEYLTSVWPGWSGLYSNEVMMWYCAWFFGNLLLQFVLPGRTREGTLLSDGTRLKYKQNATETFLLITSYLAFMTYREGFSWSLWSYLWDHQLHLITATFIFSTLQATYCYVSSFFTDELLAKHGDTGNHFYDWFIGRPLNPRILSWDLKVFSELRPGIMMWPIINFTHLAHQYTTFGYITDSMVLINIFHFWYALDSYLNEPAVLTTMDVIDDGFGYMLSFGDLCWLPMNYSLQARYLGMHPFVLGPWGIAGVLAVQASGYVIFRGANGQKNRFRTNPDAPEVKHIKYITTKSGSRLMISGWWGIARHINYLGDWVMAWAWCLPCGFKTPIPYFYVVYFAVLLIHRERRDEIKCSTKYGKDWDKYKSIVRWRIVPGVY
ncbi:ERG4/ERG24 ergosterol biosynthesis protein [Ascodesmis nigricans]|uniref:Delta(14)-sterol reductase n=1 Tax=Ascodesmis nigricans TaxID=341454 RepID=A0A4S2N8U4_9PEZI|nr:ERG4/ERG24 ergosterol biosynthesis protein [Ascodesmis nigricans]